MRIDVNAAVAFAAGAHATQVRKYTGAPYIVHPVEVMNIVRYAAGIDDPEMLAAAVLHDTVEDCDVTISEIGSMFGERVASMVYDLTDQFKDPVHGNRAKRKGMERDRLANTDASTQTIKVADMIANTHDIVAFDPKFAETYLDEKEALLAKLMRADRKLQTIAAISLAAGRKTLAQRP